MIFPRAKRFVATTGLLVSVFVAGGAAGHFLLVSRDGNLPSTRRQDSRKVSWFFEPSSVSQVGPSKLSATSSRFAARAPHLDLFSQQLPTVVSKVSNGPQPALKQKPSLPTNKGVLSSFRRGGEIAPASQQVATISPPAPVSTGDSGSPFTYEVNPDAPGNFMTSNGQKVAVEAAEPLPDGSTAMDIVVTPGDFLTKETDLSIGQRGFTPEEERFRTKWGWAAFDKAKKLATELEE